MFSQETLVGGMPRYLVKDDRLSHGCDKHEDGNGIAQEGSSTSHDPCTFCVLVFRDVRQEGAQEDRLEESQAVLEELEESSTNIGKAIGYEKGGP
jgi:hypothetical protein